MVRHSFGHCVYKFSGPDAKSRSQFQHHLQAWLLFAAFQTAYERVYHADPLTQLFLSYAPFLPVSTENNAESAWSFLLFCHSGKIAKSAGFVLQL